MNELVTAEAHVQQNIICIATDSVISLLAQCKLLFEFLY